MKVLIPDEIVESLNSGRLVLYVGSGMSQPQLPAWADLLMQMVQYAALNGIHVDAARKNDVSSLIAKGELIAAAGVVKEMLGPDFHYALRGVITSRKPKPAPTHRLLTELGLRAILTTNYDKLIEGAFGGTTARYINPKVPPLSDGFFIWKVHGDIDDAESIVFSQRHYDDAAFDARSQMVLDALFQTHTVLFLGYSIKDPDLQLVLRRLTTVLGPQARPHFALMRTKTMLAAERNAFASTYRIRIIADDTSGDHPDIEAFLRDLRDCATDGETRAHLHNGVDTESTTSQSEAFGIGTQTLQSAGLDVKIVDLCPYRGLLAFTEADADFFFGRDELIVELMERLRSSPKVLAVIGSSGSGKSSAVQAGLIPRLKEIPGFENSRVIQFRPGPAPLDAMRRALAAHIPLEANATIGDIANRVSELSKRSRVLFLADQFEETFALSADAERVQFISCLHGLIENNSEISMVLTLRADFYDQLLRSQLGQRVKYGQATVLPMSTKELESAITKPAGAAGLRLEPGLAERILEECADIDQPLPLMEFALTQLWERRQDGYLTHRAYGVIGRVAGALSSWATDAYDKLVTHNGDMVRRVFTSLVHFGKSGAPDTRRRMRLEELCSLSIDPESIRRIVTYLASRRLLVTDRDASTGEAYVEIVHDALLSEWDLLKAWIKEDHPFLSWRQWLQERVQEWEEKNRDPGALLRGELLTEALQRYKSRENELTRAESEYIQLSSEFQALEQDRLEQLNKDAARGREETLHERQISLARYLVGQAESIRTQHPEFVERGVLLALESLKRFRTVEADHALRRWLDLLPRAITRIMHEDEVRCLAFSPNGRFLATGSSDCTALVSEVRTGRQIVRVTHKGDVTSVHFSPDSKSVASASTDCTVRITDLATGDQTIELWHDFQVYSAEFSPNGFLLATASMDSTARVWAVRDGRQLGLLHHDDQVQTATFSPDGRMLATASWDSSCRVWEIPSGKELSRFIHEDRVLAVAFSPDSTFIVTASMDRSVRIWDLGLQKERLRMHHAAEVSDVTVSADGTLIASASWDCTARTWDVENGRELTRWPHEGNVYAVAFSRDGQFVATAGADHMARLFNAATGGEVARMTHSGRLHAVAFSPDSKMLASGSSDHSARVWEAGNGSATPLLIHEDGVYDVKFSPDGRLVGTASMDGTTRLWESATGRELTRLRHKAGVNTLEFSPDGRLLATASMDCTAGVWDVATGDRIVNAEHEFQVYAVDFSQDCLSVATASMDHTARIWDTATGREIRRFQHADQVNSIRFTKDGKLAVTASSDSTARVWEVGTGLEVACLTHSDAVKVATFSRDGKLVVTGSTDRSARIWDVNSKKEVARLIHDDIVFAVAISPDEQFLATASWDRTARIWSFPDGLEIKRLTHERQVCAVCFEPKGQYLATASWDRTGRIWEVSSGQEIARLGHDERIYSIVFSPDGHFVATASMDCTSRLQFWQTLDLVTYASGRVARSFTEEEWRLYMGNEPREKANVEST